MGKAYNWFRGLLGLKKSDPSSKEQLQKKKWGFAKTHKEKEFHVPQYGVVGNDKDRSNTVPEVPTAASVPSDAVIGLTVSGGRNMSNIGGRGVAAAVSTAVSIGRSGALRGSRVEQAAVMIQSHFRAYLSRRALRALKALVKLQALTRGHLVRKQTADILRRMNALLRVQARARAGRFSDVQYSGMKSSNFNDTGPATPEKFERVIRARSLKHGHQMIVKRNGLKTDGTIAVDQEKPRLNRNHNGGRTGEKLYDQIPFTRNIAIDDERIDKVLERDLGKPNPATRRKNIFHTSHLSLGSDQNCHSFSTSKNSTAHQTASSPASGEVQSLSPLEFEQDNDESNFCTANNSPQFYSASSIGGSSKREVFTPSKSDGSRSYLSGYSDHPNYMSNTESSKAKARSHSAPKQRPQYERSSSTKRYSVYGCSDSRSNTQKVSTLQANFTNRAYPGSGRLDRLGMPIRGDTVGFSGNHLNRY